MDLFTNGWYFSFGHILNTSACTQVRCVLTCLFCNCYVYITVFEWIMQQAELFFKSEIHIDTSILVFSFTHIISFQGKYVKIKSFGVF